MKLKTRFYLPTVALLVALVLPLLVSAAGSPGFLTPEAPYITLDPGVPAGSSLTAIISTGESVDGVLFEGIPDGLGLAPLTCMSTTSKALCLFRTQPISRMPRSPGGP